MKRWIVLSAACLACQAQAEIYKCRDVEGKIVYQEKPCTTMTIGRIAEAPAVPEADRKRAQEDLERLMEMNRKNMLAREQEWQKQEEARRIAEQEEQARQQAERELLVRLEQENRMRSLWSPWSPWPPFMPWGARLPHQHIPHAGEHRPSRTPEHHPPSSGSSSREEKPTSMRLKR